MATPTPERDLHAAQGLGTLLPALFEFAAMPGRFSIALREPRVAFENIQSVLMLACGRKLDTVPLAGASEADVRRVARYFVRTAMLRPGADYYTLMGVQPGFSEASLREHYRLLMRLSHPDFATPGQAWPVDAATRINQANDVLSSAVRRHEYDTTAGPASAARPQVATGVAAGMMMRRVPPKPRASLLSRLGATIALLMGGTLSMLSRFAGRKIDGNAIFPRLRSSTATLAVASVLAAIVGSVITVWWMQDDVQDAAKLAAARGLVVPDAQDGSARRPTLRSTDELELSAGIKRTPVDTKPSIEVAQVTAGQPDAPAPVSGRTSETSLIRNEGVFQYSFTPRGSRPADVVPRQPLQVQVQTYSPPPQQPPALARVQVPAQMPQVQTNQPASLEQSFATKTPPLPALPAPTPEAANLVAVAAPAPAFVAPAPPRMMPKFSLADVQPVLANVIGAMQSGHADNVLQMVDASTRRSDGAAFSEVYNKAVSGAKVVQLGKVTLSSAPLDDQLVVDGTVQLMVMDANSVTTPKDLFIRAWFVARAGNPVLTRLSATPGRQ